MHIKGPSKTQCRYFLLHLHFFTSNKSTNLNYGEYEAIIMLKSSLSLALFAAHILPLRISIDLVGSKVLLLLSCLENF
jgi:hypothetical protein